MIIGYARTSTLDQEAGFDAQIRDLTAHGCEKVFQEQVSACADRPELAAALEFVRDGDTLTVTKLDRLARSTKDLGDIAAALKAKGAALHILNINVDTNTPTGKLILDVLGAIAEFERSMMHERQREGIAKAKADGKYKGRKPIDDTKRQSVMAAYKANTAKAKIARDLNVSLSTVHRIINANGELIT